MKQDALFSSENTLLSQTAGPVICLGKTFTSDQERREYFLALLAEKLKDPEFRKIEGFPIGNDKDILNLSDPPYYTACPNPWIKDFVAEWESQKSKCIDEYHREPFAADVSEGKNDPIYNAHSYHTKVPHKAIMRYILHYTSPGDIVFDGFCGTGMTAVAAQMCGDREVVVSLGFQVNADGSILEEAFDENGKKTWKPFSKLGVRKTILNDLSTAATFISYNYNTPIDIDEFHNEVMNSINIVENELGWMYETKHTDGRIAKINYTIWSDVFICPECAKEVIFWNESVDPQADKVKEEFPCPHCSILLSKKIMARSFNTVFDKKMNVTSKQAKIVPTLINYSIDGKRFDKKPDRADIELIDKINELDTIIKYPTARMPEGKESRRNDSAGMTRVHHYFTRRNLLVFSRFWELAKSNPFYFMLTSMMFKSSLLCAPLMSNYFAAMKGNNRGGWVGKDRSGTLYNPSIHSEVSIFSQIKSRSNSTALNVGAFGNTVISASSTTSIEMESNSLDYIFIDPPFGANINYSEMNFLWESWLGVCTNNIDEAIENSTQSKGINEYRVLMTKCFRRAYELLKPGRWMTVEFSNTKSSVWNNIQTALTDAGFIVANVSALDKKQGSINAYTTPTAVKQDLVISAYKPSNGFEERFAIEAATEEGVWDFTRTHLKYLPIIKKQGQTLIRVPERDPRIIFDQVISYYVRKGHQLPPLDSKEFQIGLVQRFSERDGMFFLPEQAAEYDKNKVIYGAMGQVSLFVKDETSAIDWLRQQLRDKPQGFSDLNPYFMQQLSGWSKNEVMLDLRELLNQNFLCFDGKDDVPQQIHTYLSSNWKELRNLPKKHPALVAKAKDRWYIPDPNKTGDLEKLREKSLLKEFEEYKAAKKKLKLFRIEAVRIGFKKLWEQQEYLALIAVADKLPSNVLEEDPILLMYYDQAVTLSQIDSDDEW
ncbi:TPA: hypothetical protein R4Y10_004127 [Klebsiella aerogenes]|nr:hypothetical protein [Klebsiella aerogenes]